MQKWVVFAIPTEAKKTSRANIMETEAFIVLKIRNKILEVQIFKTEARPWMREFMCPGCLPLGSWFSLLFHIGNITGYLDSHFDKRDLSH
jgi:hypothetical protein